MVRGGLEGGPHHGDALHAGQVHQELEGGGVTQADPITAHQHPIGVPVPLPSGVVRIIIDRLVVFSPLYQPVMYGQLLLKIAHAVGNTFVQHLAAPGQDVRVPFRKSGGISALPGPADGLGVI